MDWQKQLKGFKEGAEELLDIPVMGPPCVYCKHWKPQRVYEVLTGGHSQCVKDHYWDYDKQIFDGVRLCWSTEEQEKDFSCFRSKDE